MKVDTDSAGHQEGPGRRPRVPAHQPPARLPGLRQGRRVPAAGPDDGLRPGRVAASSRRSATRRSRSRSATWCYLDRERCILCDRCTRFAKEVAGDPLIHFINRGNDTEVNTFPDEPFASYFSGNTVQICPVGALTAKPYRFKARPWDLDQVESTCQSLLGRLPRRRRSRRATRCCATSASTSIPSTGAGCATRAASASRPSTATTACASPLVRAGDGPRRRPAGPTRSRQAAGAHRRRPSTPAAPASVAVIGGARLTNEAAYAWAKLAKGVHRHRQRRLPSSATACPPRSCSACPGPPSTRSAAPAAR